MNKKRTGLTAGTSNNNGGRHKASLPHESAHSSNLLEPLVDVKPMQARATDRNKSGAYKKLQAQLAKSRKDSENRKLLRSDEATSAFMPSLLEPTHAQLVEADSRKNEALLQIYTDSGTFSKVIAMTVAASVLDAKLPYDVVQGLLDARKREEFNQFCGDINGILGIAVMRGPDANDYRRLWQLVSIFTKAMEQRICAEPRRNSSESGVKDDDGLNENLETPGPGRCKTLEETSSDAELIETIKTFNPNLYRALQDPLERFLVVYGRFVALGHVQKSNNLKNNILNQPIQRYHERVAYTLPQRQLPLQVSNVTNLDQPMGRTYASIMPSSHSARIEKQHQSLEQKTSVEKDTSQGNFSNEVLVSERDNSSPSVASGTSSHVGSNDSIIGTGEENTEFQPASFPTSRNRKKMGAKKAQKPGWPQAYNKYKTICLEGCRYDVVRRIALESGFREVGEHDVWNVIWTDVPLSLEKALEMRRFQNAHAIFWGTSPPVQKANHFPGMNEICRKDRLARNLNRMKKSFPEDYDFFPRTWSLPADVNDLLAYSRLKKNATYICKPDSGCQGKGIFLVKNLKKLNPFSKLICQVYIPKPLLIDGYKFDLRIYILVTSCDPLRVFIYNEGIARFATVKYSPPSDTNIDVVYMHLTNYSLNKFSQSYDLHSEGSKRKMSAVLKLLGEYGYDTSRLRDSIDAVVVKTMIAAQPTLRHYYRASFPKHDIGSACFEILGFDIIIDRNLKPFLLEVNHSPSFNLDLPVDAETKEALLRDTFAIIYMGHGSNDKRRKNSGAHLATNQEPLSNRLTQALQMQVQHEAKNCANYRLIYPLDNAMDYGTFFDQSSCPTMADATSSSQLKS